MSKTTMTKSEFDEKLNLACKQLDTCKDITECDKLFRELEKGMDKDELVRYLDNEIKSFLTSIGGISNSRS
jgi:hypothetical protein